MSFKHLALVGVSAILSTCIPSAEPHIGNHLKIVSPKSGDTTGANFRLIVEKCDYEINGWNVELDSKKLFEKRPGTFPFDTTINFVNEGSHDLIVTSWDRGGNIQKDTIYLKNNL
tara:strand:+ start:481 stop:825 length:345 start_codon:yes stop_codon:yes gene_type:complete